MAEVRYCPSCGLPLSSLERHGRLRDCIYALQARVAALEAALQAIEDADRRAWARQAARLMATDDEAA